VTTPESRRLPGDADGALTAFRHAPYAQGKAPFAIGLTRFEIADWIEVDDALASQLSLKAAIIANEGAAAFDALAGSEPAQAETLELLTQHLCARYPSAYRREGAAIRIAPAGRLIPLAGEAPLLVASRLVQEDLLLLRRDDDGWRLVAGSLCFPSTWILAEKLGRRLDEIHAPVPGYAGKMASTVDRIFDNLRVELPVERFNASVYGDARLRHAQSRQDPDERFPPDVPIAECAYIRVERQTLRRLPVSGAILFTVRVYVDPLSALRQNPRGRALALALRNEIAALRPEQIAYKGLSAARERLLAALATLAEGAC